MRQVKAEHFVRLWLEAYEDGDGIAWISERMNRPTSTVNGMAATLRREGIKLPTLRRRHIEAVNIEDLNRMIKEQLGEYRG
jgi:hypothetical protein